MNKYRANRAKLLVLTPRFPYPTVGGDKLRIYNLCKVLAEEYDLTLLSLCSSREEMLLPIPDDGIFASVERVHHGKLRSIAGCLAALPTGNPIQTGYYYSPAFARKLKSLLPSHDGVLAHLIRTGVYVRKSHKPTIVEMTDAISMTYRRRSELMKSNPLGALAYQFEANRLLTCERQLIQDVDMSILVSPIDRDYLLNRQENESVQVCSNGVDTKRFPFQYDPDGRTIVFIGNNTALHNADAIMAFATEIFPKIKLRRPDAQLKVVGKIREHLRESLEQQSGVIVTGAVERVAAATARATCSICPVRWGAGVQNKVLEYMSLGIPAVTSPIGLEGIDATPGRHLLVAETDEEWVDQICGLLERPSSGERMAREARKYVEAHHSWEALLEPIRLGIRDLLRADKTA